MAKPIKSVLLVDYDSLHRSLSGAGGEAAGRLAARVSAWVAAIESGELLGRGGSERTIAVRRCYADPGLLGQGRDRFAAADFEVVPCPPGGAGTRSADINMTVDAMERLADPAGYAEFIVLSAEPSVAPLLTRIRQNGRKTAIYADAATTPGHRALADSVLEIAAFAAFLLTPEAAEASAAASSPERSEIEAFARKVHAATNIPLFSPKTFAEMFHYLTEEIATNGYHFQTTAKNVANRLIESGRSVTRRQVVFVVKGLALKGHVFSTTDTPRRLAEVFQEQANYLIQNAGLTLDEQQERLLSAWLVDRVSTAAPSPAAIPAKSSAEPTAAAPEAAAVEKPAVAAGAEPDAAKSAEEKAAPGPATPAVEEKPVAGAPTPAAEERPAAAQARPPAAARPAAPARPAAGMLSPDDARAAIAARVAASVRAKSASRPGSPPDKPPPKSPPTARETEGARSSHEPESIENSILAAIAEAVDVLVEGTGGKTKRVPQTPARKRPPPPPPEPKPKPQARPKPEPIAQDDDIGNEIQRIIATYNRERREPPSK